MLKTRQLIDMFSRYYHSGTSSIAFWWLPVGVGCGAYRLQEGLPCDYYVDLSSKTQYVLHIDDNGVIQLDYMGEIGVRYNPCSIAQYGLGHFSVFLKTLSSENLRRACKQGDWLCSNMVVDSDGRGRWEYHFGNEGFPDVKLPFISAIAQGQGISLLLRLFAQTGNVKYKLAADAAFLPFLFNLHEGGVCNTDSSGRLYLEELPTKKVSCILDGFIYAIFGVYDYYQITGSKDAKNVFQKSIETLYYILPDYDLKYWSRTDCILDKPKMPASHFYHNVHIQQLRAMYLITGEPIYLQYANKWQSYQQSFLCRMLAVIYKSIYKVIYY